ncbi:MAG TPA: DUF6607 family protein [Burkholderiales bacterium]|nr:DUF6607 family protein [Burkholderiales bacterium]
MRLSSILVAALLPFAVHAYEPGSREASDISRYTFAWPIGETMLKPRGASTKGTPVTLDMEPAQEWTRLHAANLSDFERDRRAILAMAGPYRVSFDFLEVARYDPALKPDAPYQSWGTEYVFVSEDRKDFIALQHILVMRVLQQDGTESEPLITRHWRQEWRYQSDTALVYQGTNTWVMRKIPEGQRRGAWVQSVYQVDDSPRYSAIGRWQHSDSFSTWISDETWRPLPRREWSVRKDYQVLVGTNRHTITATGWIQEENNLKLVLDETGKPREALPYLAREYGVARYERIRNFDFIPGREYFDKTEPFWSEVRAAWKEIIRGGGFRLVKPVDQGQLFVPFFEYAQRLADGEPFVLEEARSFIQKNLRQNYLAPA